MQAIHWLRSRQEKQELVYWLSLVFYNPRDRSAANRIYLVYLLLFFSAWIFIVLTFFGSAGAVLFHLFLPGDPIRAAVFLELLLIGIWNVIACSKASRQSPLIFSEQDEVLICQTPVNRRQLVMRWFLMPWLKSAVPFWAAAIILGFSVVEIIYPGGITVNSILPYLRYGLHAWLVMLPLHLACTAMQWVIGVYRLQANRERSWLRWTAAPTAAVLFLLLIAMLSSPQLLPGWVNSISGMLLYPLRAGFGTGNILLAVVSTGVFAAAMLGVLYGAAGKFSLSRAAQETKLTDVLNSAGRYGFGSYAHSLQTQQRLGFKPKPFWRSGLSGAGVLIWKDVLQRKRSFHPGALMPALGIFLLMAGVPFLPDPITRLVLIVVWMLQIGEGSIIRLRDDLAHWTLIRQLPIDHGRFLLAESCSTVILPILISLMGLLTGTMLLGKAMDPLVFLLPGITAGITGMMAVDILRQSHGHHLVNGFVPSNGSGGTLLGIGLSAVPLVTLIMLPGTIGLVAATLVSAAGAVFAFHLAVRAYHNLDR